MAAICQGIQIPTSSTSVRQKDQCSNCVKLEAQLEALTKKSGQSKVGRAIGNIIHALSPRKISCFYFYIILRLIKTKNFCFLSFYIDRVDESLTKDRDNLRAELNDEQRKNEELL